MSVHDWKFHDFNMLLDARVNVYGERETFPVVYAMTHLAKGSLCLLCGDREDARWLRKTKNESMNGSTRYMVYDNLNDAMDASIKWARRKDEERAARLREEEERKVR